MRESSNKEHLTQQHIVLSVAEYNYSLMQGIVLRVVSFCKPFLYRKVSMGILTSNFADYGLYKEHQIDIDV